MKTGLYFGSFNPLHNGHLAIAESITKAYSCEVWFIVSPLNPLKEMSGMIPGKTRLEMVEKAIEGKEGLGCSDIELNMPVPSYSIDTLKKLGSEYPDRDFFLIMGEDNLDYLYKWKDYKKIIREYELMIYPRANEGNEADWRKNPKLSEARIIFINAPLMNISSTEIRGLIKEKRDVTSLLHSTTIDYIKKNGLYH